ncbi:MAG TPA: polysaccharide biosynthesis/export family protein [Methylomirabilota bacterium]|jgi:polysaccharide export outer membrane protein|nr:polysaccharide biosynthesis/export family protein [Methylomirabilota bacterium]
MKIRTVLPGLLVLLVAVPVVAWAQAPAPAVRDGKADARTDYQIGPEDVLDIAVWNNTSLSRTTPVRPDGKISLPLLNDVQAAGLTPMQLREVITKKLTEYMPNPEVSVIVREVNHFKVSVLGEVKKPGRYDLKGQTTVLDAIALAGGLNDFAARSRITILRNNGSSTSRIPVNYNKIFSAGSEQENLVLQPGDIVLVP